MTTPLGGPRALQGLGSAESEIVLNHQRQWAVGRNLELSPNGSRFVFFDDSLLVPLDEQTRSEFAGGAGGELSRMPSLRSSSALAVNMFLPWRADPTPLLSVFASEGPSDTLSFEVQHPTGVTGRHPHLDVVITTSGPPVAIESKFLEPYDEPSAQSMSNAYLDRDDLWVGLSRVREVAEAIANGRSPFRRFGAAQLIKHVLGLSRSLGAGGLRLAYLWYKVPGDAAGEVELEAEDFRVAVGDDIDFRAMTYQDLFADVVGLREPVPGYFRYLEDRYFSISCRGVSTPLSGIGT
jgi:hypothetical protein